MTDAEIARDRVRDWKSAIERARAALTRAKAAEGKEAEETTWVEVCAAFKDLQRRLRGSPAPLGYGKTP